MVRQTFEFIYFRERGGGICFVAKKLVERQWTAETDVLQSWSTPTITCGSRSTSKRMIYGTRPARRFERRR